VTLPSRTFHPNTPGPKTASIATLEEGRYVDGRWVPGRRLNGDVPGVAPRAWSGRHNGNMGSYRLALAVQ
jgi:hypothetical protein